jgi:hypothetical protein
LAQLKNTSTINTVRKKQLVLVDCSLYAKWKAILSDYIVTEELLLATTVDAYV